MIVPVGAIRVGRNENLVIQVVGSGTMRESATVAAFAEHCLAAGATRVRVDLSRCVYLDSTFLGTLLSVKRSIGRLSEGSFALLAPTAECRELLQRMKLDQVFPIEDARLAEPSDWTNLPCQAPEGDRFETNVITAHQELANVEGPCGAAFRALADSLTKEFELRAKGRA